MMTLRTLFLISIVWPALVVAQEGSGIGYPTVGAALDALKARSDVSISVQGGWTIIEDGAHHTIWSFTPADHAAHPAAVRREVVQQNGAVAINMTALCQASKVACDKLMEDFATLNARMGKELSPAGTQDERVEAFSRQYFLAQDEGRYRDAYGMMTASQQQLLPFSRWNFLEQDFGARAGKLIRRDIRKVTWYRDPPQAAPGVYAAVDFAGEYANTSLYCGYLVLSQQADGTFLVLREERNVIDKETAAKLQPGELEKFSARFKCK